MPLVICAVGGIYASAAQPTEVVRVFPVQTSGQILGIVLANLVQALAQEGALQRFFVMTAEPVDHPSGDHDPVYFRIQRKCRGERARQGCNQRIQQGGRQIGVPLELNLEGVQTILIGCLPPYRDRFGGESGMDPGAQRGQAFQDLCDTSTGGKGIQMVGTTALANSLDDLAVEFKRECQMSDLPLDAIRSVEGNAARLVVIQAAANARADRDQQGFSERRLAGPAIPVHVGCNERGNVVDDMPLQFGERFAQPGLKPERLCGGPPEGTGTQYSVVVGVDRSAD